jgi:predicted ATPase/class 3 adenylate cyclase
MHNLVPNYILEKYELGEYRGSDPAVGMFVDISGFSLITDDLMKHGQHGAEILANVMRNIFSPLIRSIYEQDGFVSTLAGDAFTAIFPLSVNADQVCLHVLTAAWKIREALDGIAKQSTPYGDFIISGKIGIAKGEASWGLVSSVNEQRAAYYFQGTAVEESALLESKANAGEILINSDFHSCVNKNTSVELVGDYIRITDIIGELCPPQTIAHPVVTSEVLYRFFPQSLFLEKSIGEFRQVVTMFINLPTVRTEDQLEIFMQSLFDLQDKYGGLLTRLDFGDKGSNLLIFWGAPVAYENDINRALNLILDLQIRTSIPINAGITYQISHAGFIGSAIREEYSTYGRGVNLAARFMKAAQRGDIWIDEEIANRAASQFEIELIGDLAFKGFTEKQRVYLLEDRKDVVETFYQTDMVGRHVELEQMKAFIKPLTEGKYSGALIILGEPGIGKTRLVYEFKKMADLQDIDFLWALCQSDQAMRESLNPFRYWLYQYFSISKSQSESRNKRSFNRKLDGLIATLEDEILASELDRTRSFLGAMVGLYWPDSLSEQLDPQGRYDNTLIGLISLIQAESTLQPIILHIEDAQWIDADSEKLLAQLDRTIKSDESNSYPIAIIATARMEFVSSGLSERLSHQEIKLEELTPDALESLADQILAGPASPKLLEQLLERTDGNPFFAEQSLLYLKEEGLLKRKDNLWTAAEHYSLPLPDNVRALLVSRLDRLSQEVKDVVLTASVLGREFEIQLLSQMLDGDSALPEKVAVAEQNTIWTALNELRYLFNHALLHDAAYRMQVHARRQVLHELAVRAIEVLYSKDLSSHSVDLAYHCEQAGLLEKALGYLIEAAIVAKGGYQNTQAVDYLGRALQLTPEEDFQTRFKILIEREALLRFLGRQEEQQHDLENLNTLIDSSWNNSTDIEKLKYHSKVALRWANYHSDIGNFDTAIDSAKEAISLNQQAIMTEDVVEAFFFWSHGLYRQGKYDEAIEKGGEGLSHALKTGYREGESRLLNLLGMIAFEQEKLAEAQKYFLNSLNIAEEIGNLRLQAMTLNNLGNDTLTSGNFSAAQDYYERSLKLARQIGDRSGEGLVLGNLGYIAGIQGDYSTAREYNGQALRSARQVGNRIQEGYALINSSSVLRSLKEYPSALEHAKLGLSIALEIGDRNGEAWSFTILGNTHFEIGDLEAAAAAFERAVELRQSMEQLNLACEPLAGQARVALAKGDIAGAIKNINPILKYLDQGGTLNGTEEPIQVYLTCFQVLHQVNDPQAKLILEDGYAQLQTRGDGIKNKAMRNIFFENIPHNRNLLSEWEKFQN